MSMKSDDFDEQSLVQSGNRYMHEDGESTSTPQNKSDARMILEQERFLPIANISRIMKRVIPESGKLSKEAKECIQECVTEFLLFITSEASEKCLLEKRKTITGEDLLTAFQTLGFDDYLEPLKEVLQKYREANKLEKPKIEFDENHMESNHPTSTLNQMPTTMILPQNSDNIVHNDVASITVESPRNAPTTLQAMQVLVDPSTGQHYITVTNPNGTQTLLPVQVTANAEAAKSIVGMGTGQMVQQSLMQESSGAASSQCVTAYYTTDMQ